MVRLLELRAFLLDFVVEGRALTFHELTALLYQSAGRFLDLRDVRLHQVRVLLFLFEGDRLGPLLML